MSSPVWKFFSVAEEDNAIAICNVCSARILRGGKKASSFNTTNLISHLKGRHRGEAVLRDFKQPPLLERQWYSNVILLVRDFNCYFVAFYCNRLLRENSCFACIQCSNYTVDFGGAHFFNFSLITGGGFVRLQ